ncbi:MAG: hypothetical protein JNN08_03230, partial [Bryobacterales bacterium]|nr:hypothetical protein [Bryobacterales bacterium]
VWGFYGGDGTQATADGVMEGTVSGRTARLRWQVRNGQLWGGAMFVLSSDGTTMTGSRNDYREPEFAQFKWNAERVR